ncbi:autotransporter domain-containing protein [Microvirga mediterraneensis]|uniref:Autotransporter domain-containing protein n=1 Tax=Microvirga mediterraneensis TaxID=2754695 RepID=A0A838BSF5_9HYPH|nr:autotransporter domain-containing protein [Microvirga mediterraneensis]MBA1158744.1 autotransporter domain-containing protein [Microvirga mediterraneensis]
MSTTPAASQAWWISDAAELNAAIGYENQYNVGTLFLITNSFTAANPTLVQVVPTIHLQNYAIGISGLSGAGGFNVYSYGLGTLTLTGINSFTGGLGINSATVRIDGGAALGGGAVALNSATLQLTNNASLYNGISLGNLGATIDTAGFSLTANGPISGPAGMFLIGGGTLTLTGANTYAGGTTVNNGRAIVAASGALGTGPVILNGDTASLSFDGAAVNAGPLNIALNDSSQLTFRNGASAGGSTITVAADATPRLGAGLFFGTGATADNATIVNELAPGYSGVTFRSGSNAGNATIENRNGSVTGFEGTSSGGSATITNRSFGTVLFQDSSTAGSATIINEASGQAYFSSNATGGNARMVNKAGGLVDISALNGAGITFGSIEGGGRFNLGSKTLTAGSNDRSTTVSGLIQGIGSLVKTGSGEMTLSGTNTYTGGTTITDGTIAVSQNTNLGASGDLTLDGGALRAISTFTTSRAVTLGPANGLFEVDAGANLTLDGVISGVGGLAKAGEGTLHLNHANTYSGGTQIHDGALYVGANGALGTGPVLVEGPTADVRLGPGVSAGDLAMTLDGGRLFFSDRSSAGNARIRSQAGGSVRFEGGASAGGAAFDNVGGTIAFTADSTADHAAINNRADGRIDLSGHTGPLAIGSLTGAGTVFLGGNTLILGRNNASSVLEGSLRDGGLMAGLGGGLIKAGTGALELTGASTYTGETLVQAGTLKVNGSLVSSPVTVQADAALSGAGTVGGILARYGSTIAPGNSIGALNVAGSVAFSAGSIYAVEIDSAGRSDLITATGAASLAGGTVQVLPDQGTGYKANSPYTILSARSGVTGTFTGTTGGEFAFIVPTLGYTNDKVTLTMVRKVEPQQPEPPLPPQPVAFHSVAQTRNQYTTADGVEALGAGNRLYDAVLGTSAPGARQAFDALSGEAHATAAGVALGDAERVRNGLLTRLRQPLAARPAQPDAPAPGRFALWGEGFGSWGRAGANGNAAGLDTATGGFILGADAPVADAVRLGLAGGLIRTGFDIDGRLASGRTESVFGALYGSGAWGGVTLRLGAASAGHALEVNRAIRFPGFRDQTGASYDGWSAQAFGEAGYRIDLGPVQLEPFAGAAVLRLHTDGFAEDGGAAALTGSARVHALATTTLGVRAEARLSDTVPLVARGLLGWRHAYGDVEPAALLAFGGGASVFSVAGTPVDRDALVAEAGLDWQASDAISLGVAYAGQIGAQAQEHAVKGNLTWRF